MTDAITISFNLANAMSLRQFDWAAYRDPESPMIGYGATGAEALADFQRLEAKDECARRRLEAEDECARRSCGEVCDDCPLGSA